MHRRQLHRGTATDATWRPPICSSKFCCQGWSCGSSTSALSTARPCGVGMSRPQYSLPTIRTFKGLRRKMVALCPLPRPCRARSRLEEPVFKMSRCRELGAQRMLVAGRRTSSHDPSHRATGAANRLVLAMSQQANTTEAAHRGGGDCKRSNDEAAPTTTGHQEKHYWEEAFAPLRRRLQTGR